MSFAVGFELLKSALSSVMPLKRAHERELPRNIQALSRLLTVERSELRRPYWAKPPLAGAYLHYYLPWNVYRLHRLLSGLDLSPGEAEKGFVLDLGSGPLSLPIALWLARPDLRKRRLRVLAVDCAGHPLQLGRRILERMAREAGLEPWDIRTLQAPILQGLKEAGAWVAKGHVPLLVSAANVLNELPFPQRTGFGEREDDEDERDLDNGSRLAEVAAAMARLVRRGEGTRLLLVEPGTRLGGLTLMRVRGLLSREGLEIAAPCPHQGPCPLLAGGEADFGEDLDFDFAEEFPGEIPGDAHAGAARPGSLAGRTWCHCVFSSHGAPRWLVELSKAAGFARERLSLAFVEAFAPEREGGGPAAEKGRERGALPAGTESGTENSTGNAAEIAARIISGPFVVPGAGASCRYACSDRGLLLLQNAAELPAGSLACLSVEGLGNAPADRKSGARVLSVRMPREHAPKGHESGGRGERNHGSARPEVRERPAGARGKEHLGMAQPESRGRGRPGGRRSGSSRRPR